MIAADFGTESKNPRVRRAYADTLIGMLGRNEVNFSLAREAIDATANPGKSEKSGYETRLFQAATKLGSNVVRQVAFICWTRTNSIDGRKAFGGYAMSQEEATEWKTLVDGSRWAVIHEGYGDTLYLAHVLPPESNGELPEHKEVEFSYLDDDAPAVVMGEPYDLALDPAPVRVDYVSDTPRVVV